MNTVLTLLCFTLMSLLPLSSSAADAGTGGGNFAFGARIMLAAQTGSLDLFDSTDHLITPGWAWQGGVYHAKNQDGWLGDTGFYSNDYRAPLVPGETKSWTFYIWAVPGTPVSSCGVNGGLWSNDPVKLNVLLEYIQRPAGIAGGPPIGTTWTPQTPVNVLLPFYSTSNGRTGYGFKFTLTMVPEPSSLLALAGGLAGLGGIALRHRRA